jgi:DNA-binding transcriptional LysR family regulator
LLPRAIAQFRRQFPEERIVLQTLIPTVMQQSLLTQQVELGVAYMPVEHPSLAWQPLYENQIVAVLPKGHPLAARGRVTVHDLAEEPLIGYSADIPFGMLINKLFGGEHAQPEPRIEVQQAHVACALVQAGAGVALVDEITVAGPIWSEVVTLPIIGTVNAPCSTSSTSAAESARRLDHAPRGYPSDPFPAAQPLRYERVQQLTSCYVQSIKGNTTLSRLLPMIPPSIPQPLRESLK